MQAYPWVKNDPAYTKMYREFHQEKIVQYRRDHSESIKELKNTKFNCRCGGTYTYANKTKHYRTDKHLTNINPSSPYH